MLAGNENGVNSSGDDDFSVMFVFDSHLDLSVGSHPGDDLLLSALL